MLARILVAAVIMSAHSASLFADGDSATNKEKLAIIARNMGSQRFDGTLRFGVGLFPLATFKDIHTNVGLVHRVEKDIDGRCVTAWDLIGLRSFIVRAGRGAYRWLALSGELKLLEANRRERDPLIIEDRDDDTIVVACAESTWKYRGGVLECFSIGGNHYKVDTRGALITKIERSTGEHSIIVSAIYDVQGRVVKISTWDSREWQFVWKAGRLAEMRDLRRAMWFTYDDGLIASTIEEGGRTKRYSWAANDGADRGDSKWLSPVQLRGDGESEYEARLTHSGIEYIRTGKRNSLHVKTIVNPATGNVEQHVFGKVTIATLAPSAKTP